MLALRVPVRLVLWIPRILIGIAFCLIQSCATQPTTLNQAPLTAACPDLSLGETQEDCPWALVARNLIAESESGRPLLPLFQKSLPDLVTQVQKDAKNPFFKQLWGQSINFDEFAKGIIVHPEIIQTLNKLFGIQTTQTPDRVVHAGLEHVYGYLFSVLKTPYGYKRARWVKPTLEQAFELTSKTLAPTPHQGTLFSNLTYFIGKIAFRNDPKELRILNRGIKTSDNVSSALATFPYKNLKITRLVETVLVPTSSNQSRKVFLRTDFVPFKQVPQGQLNSHLLIYSVIDPDQGGARLITAFPVESGFVKKGISPELLGNNQPIKARYNAYIEGLSGHELTGERQVIQK